VYKNSQKSALHVEAAWEQAHVEGQAMTLDEAISYALEEEEASG
jgi:hypothetical protein